MIGKARVVALLVTPPLAGRFAPLLSVAALAIPTAILSLDQALPAGACCTTYFPFVLLSAVLMGSVYASAVAVGSAGLADALFMGPPFQLFESPMDSFGSIASLVSSALIIALVFLFRKLLVHGSRPEGCASGSGIIFSLEKGVAWANGTGASGPVRLGPQEEVAAMMQDFLMQLELGKRLTKRPS
jgi:hypothetical protein